MNHKQFKVAHRAISNWRLLAAKSDPDAPVDGAILKQFFEIRQILATAIPRQYSLRLCLKGSPYLVWQHIQREYGLDGSKEAFAKLPTSLRPFVEAKITAWRSHKLFGRAVLDPFINGEDRRGQDPFISIHADELLKTEMDHHHAITIWCDREKMAQGNYTEGQVVYYGNG